MSEINRDRMPYLLYFARQRLLLENIDAKVVDIGSAEIVGNHFRWKLDGKNAQGETAKEVDELLEEVERHLSFLFVDGQFTSLPDVSEDYGDRLDNMPFVEVSLSELSDRDEGSVR
ncbi:MULTISPECIES: hypothetical protein [Pantoea]|jgi:hypothetical protein|uniref:Uncharacterized protein n=1 Tax=Pantoea eucrina TaxID=472693 RepID=A0ABS1Z5D0_9GAMM|nr:MULTISPECIES: hypothetical protein [Pantoea]AJA71147.1 hypothetical protein PSNIH1_p01375 [Pantoea sp. PSNIH1]QNH53050.1 hypothetical protein HWI77_17235 [Acinetobacter venetianus]KAA6044353.1 hypothetical protein F3I35_13940 [Pantoea sp. Bo_7]KAA6090130.1 hypothetical protein F3I22_13945 [Pantoea sp. Bo_10]MBM0747649.1 hypothetical protein [Pantoea eucrina]